MFSTFLAVTLLAAQPSASLKPLTPEILQKYTTHFRIEERTLKGPGADLLLAEVAKAHATLLGEYHFSTQISDLTGALIPALNKAGYKHFVVETGPHAAKVLREVAREGKDIARNLRSFYTKYRVDDGGEGFPAIPFFYYTCDAQILEEATKHGWNLIGVDQEFLAGWLPLLDRAIAKLPSALRAKHALVLNKMRAVVEANYKLLAEGRETFRAHIEIEGDLAAGFEVLKRAKGEPATLARNLEVSNEIYRLNSVKEWFKSNETRIRHMKTNLELGLRESRFVPGKDRIFAKMGSVHTGRGLSLLRLYELGNTMSELVDSHGGRSLHLVVCDRFWVDGKTVSDSLEQDKRYEVLRKLGKPDEWTLIDLRPLRTTILYDNLSYEKFVGEFFEQHDMVLIPPADTAPTPNRD